MQTHATTRKNQNRPKRLTCATNKSPAYCVSVLLTANMHLQKDVYVDTYCSRIPHKYTIRVTNAIPYLAPHRLHEYRNLSTTRTAQSESAP